MIATAIFFVAIEKFNASVHIARLQHHQPLYLKAKKKITVANYIHWVLQIMSKIDATKTAPCRKVLVVTELFNIVVNDFHSNKSTRCRRVLVVTELIVSGTHCTVNGMATQ